MIPDPRRAPQENEQAIIELKVLHDMLASAYENGIPSVTVFAARDRVRALSQALAALRALTTEDDQSRSDQSGRSTADLRDGQWRPIESAPKDGTDVLLRTTSIPAVVAYYDDSLIPTPGHTNWRVRFDGDVLASALMWAPLPSAPSMPREGEFVNIKKTTYRVTRVTWALDQADRYEPEKKLRANVELEPKGPA